MCGSTDHQTIELFQYESLILDDKNNLKSTLKSASPQERNKVILDSVETRKISGFSSSGEGTDTMQALLGKCVLLLLTANRYKVDDISVNYRWQVCL